MSSNFDFLASYDTRLAQFGADAEQFAFQKPDLTLFRLRQFAETICIQIYSRLNLRRSHAYHLELSLRIETLYSGHYLSNDATAHLRTLQKAGNEAVHPEDSPQPKRTDKHQRQQAMVALEAAFKLGVWFAEDICNATLDGRAFQKPTPQVTRDNTGPERLAEIEMLLEAARRFGETQRQLDLADKKLSEATTRLGKEKYIKEIDETTVALLRLRADSIARAIANHRGDAPKPFDKETFKERCALFVQQRNSTYWDEVAEYGNRLAVAEMNAFRFEAAIDFTTELIQWRRNLGSAGSDLFQADKGTDWNLGALLGTRGQAYCFLAHVMNDPSCIDEGILNFQEAANNFDDSGDISRQIVYQAHAALERIRLGAEQLSEPELQLCQRLNKETDDNVNQILQTGWEAEHTPLLFAMDIHLKGADLGVWPAPSWARNVASLVAQAVEDKLRLEHPLESVCGRLWLLLGQDCPKAVRETVQSMANSQSDQPPLVPFLSQAFLLERAHRQTFTPSAEDIDLFLALRPPEFVAIWEEFNLGGRFEELTAKEGRGPLRIIPFNYS